MIYESLVHSINGPTYVRVRVENGVTMIYSTGCDKRIYVREGEQVTIETAVMAMTIDSPVRIRAERLGKCNAEGKVTG